MELHERWLADLRSERMKDKLALAEGKITNEEYMEKNTGRDVRFIEAGKLYQGDEKILVLVPHGTPEQLNSHSLQFWELQEILTNATFQEDPDSADLKDPSFTLMDPSFEERFKEGGLIQQEIAKADIVLEISYLGDWTVVKTPYVELDDSYRWAVKLPEVTLTELLVNNPKDVWVYIDHRQVDTNKCENLYHAFARYMQELRYTDINLHLMSGHPTPEWKRDKEIVLMATPIGFFVKVAPQTPHVQKLITIKELIGHDETVNSTLTSQPRGSGPSPDKVWSPVDPNTLMHRY